MTQPFSTQQDVVKKLRKIRDEISKEIKDMTFEQEREYLDKLLAKKEKYAPNNRRCGGGRNAEFAIAFYCAAVPTGF